MSGNGVNRQIQGVADAAVNATSTDAVNGSQLFQTIQAFNGLASNIPDASADNVNALPAPTVAAGSNGLAVGFGAATTGTNSVALGNGSTDGGRSNVVSVGSAGAERQITNVAAGVAPTDAVNVSQLGAVSNQVANLSSRVDNLALGLQNLSGQVQRNQLEARRGTAVAAALANMPFGTTPGKWSTAAGFSNYRGQTAFAGGVQYNFDTDLRLKVRATGSFVPGTNDFTFGGGAGLEF